MEVETSLPSRLYILSACLVPGTGLGEGAAANKGTHPQTQELLLFQENGIRNDNTLKEPPPAVTRRQDTHL